MNIDLDNLDETGIYEALGVEGHEDDALNDSYLDLYELLGKEATLKLFKYFRGDKIYSQFLLSVRLLIITACFHIPWQENIEKYCSYKNYSNAVLRKYRFHHIGEYTEYLRALCETKSYAER